MRHIYYSIIIFIIINGFNLQAQELDFIRTDINQIEMNGDNWDSLSKKLGDITVFTGNKFNILHIGDSHIQADYMTAVTRRLLQQQFGNGGHGCISPLKLAGTNQPEAYSFTADATPAAKRRLNRGDKEITTGVTGVGIAFDNSTSHHLTVTLHGDDSLYSHITLLHSPSDKYDTVYIDNVPYVGRELSAYATSYNLAAEVQSATLDVNIDGTLYGAYITNDRPGIIYNSIGNNGACFSDYLEITDFAQQTELFAPDLIILSFGTNEAFGKSSDNEIYDNIDQLVTSLKRANPNAKFLLTTPMECQKRLSRSRYTPNSRIVKVRNVIKKYCSEKHIPVWDLYEIAGGNGSSRKWIANGLLSTRDRVHCQVIGYELQGSLLADALLNQLLIFALQR